MARSVSISARMVAVGGICVDGMFYASSAPFMGGCV